MEAADEGRPTRSVERTAAPLLRSTPSGSSRVPRALHRPCRRRSLTSGGENGAAFDLLKIFFAVSTVTKLLQKRQGKIQQFKCGTIPFADGLFEREVFLDCGRSMLRRFQEEGESLEDEVVHDRLLLTY
jgi:hypothetical protein